jgi:hypothetical protein
MTGAVQAEINKPERADNTKRKKFLMKMDIKMKR